MSLDASKLKEAGMNESKKYVPVPDEWESDGFREVTSKKDGKQYTLVDFTDTNGKVLTLFGHSMEIVDGKLFVKPRHLKRQLSRLE